MCFDLRTHRRYGSFAVKITSEVSFFVAHSGVFSCSVDAPKDSGTICFECFEWKQCRFKKLFWAVSLFSFAFEAGHTKVNMWGNWILSAGGVSCFCLSVKSHRALFIKKRTIDKDMSDLCTNDVGFVSSLFCKNIIY